MRTLALILFAVVAACERTQPTFGEHIGLAETEVRKRWGAPTAELVKRATDMVGELRGSLVSTHLNGEDVFVKELYYKRNGEQIFWLKEARKDRWIVFADVHVPPGALF